MAGRLIHHSSHAGSESVATLGPAPMNALINQLFTYPAMRKSTWWGQPQQVSLLSGGTPTGQSSGFPAKAATRLGVSWPDHKETNSTPPSRRASVTWVSLSQRGQSTRIVFGSSKRLQCPNRRDLYLSPTPVAVLGSRFSWPSWRARLESAQHPSIRGSGCHQLPILSSASILLSLLTSGQSALGAGISFRVERLIQHKMCLAPV
jgi:hypothetical protein